MMANKMIIPNAGFFTAGKMTKANPVMNTAAGMTIVMK